MPPAQPFGGMTCFMERIEKRASARLRYSRRMPSPPRNSPAPPESAISSKRMTRVGNSLSMISTGAILALLWLTVMPGHAVLARARAGAAGDDLVLHVALAGIGAAAAEDDGAAAAAVGAHLARHDVAQRVEDGVDQRVDGRIVGVDRRREARIEHAAVARGHGEAAQQPLDT